MAVFDENFLPQVSQMWFFMLVWIVMMCCASSLSEEKHLEQWMHLQSLIVGTVLLVCGCILMPIRMFDQMQFHAGF